MPLEMNGKLVHSHHSPSRGYNNHNNHNNQPWRSPSQPASNGHNANTANTLAERRKLPIFPAKAKFLEEAVKNKTVILLGETGSGKTTQIPQFIHEARLDRTGAVAVTQPRRVAAVSLAKRVAKEMATDVGGLVGYRVRFEDCSDHRTRIIYQTDGMLLREAMLDPLLSRYSWILLDEAHERTVNTDILFGVVKSAQAQRDLSPNANNSQEASRLPPLRVVVMSATVDADKFSSYWRSCPVLYVEGRQFPVNVRHVSSPTDDYQRALLSTVFQIHATAPDRQDILAFLTGQEEIESVARQARLLSREFPDAPKLFVMPLYAAQPADHQQNVFKDTGPGTRKLVLSTNIAETSVTVPGLKFVVDSCRVKAKVHQATAGLDLLKVVKVSKAQAWQRTGRAGRQSEGTCYRLITAEQFEALPASTVPEIQRSNLSTVVLTMLSIGIKDINSFDFMDPPSSDSLNMALRQLSLLGATELNVEGPGVRLTALGKKMSGFPLEPRLTACLLAAQARGCGEEILSIVSLLCADTIFQLPGPKEKREEAQMCHRKYQANEGDLVSLLNVWRAYKSGPKTAAWCRSQYLINRNLMFADEIRRQLVGVCHSAGIQLQSSRDMDNVRQALATGLFLNVAQLTVDGHYVALDSGHHVHIHPSSVLFNKKPEMVVYTEMVSTTKTYIRGLTLVQESWLQESNPEYFRTHRITR